LAIDQGGEHHVGNDPSGLRGEFGGQIKRPGGSRLSRRSGKGRGIVGHGLRTKGWRGGPALVLPALAFGTGQALAPGPAEQSPHEPIARELARPVDQHFTDQTWIGDHQWRAGTGQLQRGLIEDRGGDHGRYIGYSGPQHVPNRRRVRSEAEMG
jgi:hypothetical protein